MDYKNKSFKVAFTYRNTEENTDFVNIIYYGLINSGIDANDIFLDNKQPHLVKLNSEHLPSILPLIYQNSNVVVVCFAEGYEESKWCGLEFKSVLDILLEKNGNETFLIKLDDSSLPRQLKNFNFLKKDKVEDNNIIKEIIRRSAIKSNPIKSIDNVVSNCTFKLRDHQYYETISKKIKIYYKIKGKNTQPPLFFGRAHLFEKIKNKIDEKGFVFIEGALLAGKTSLINCYSKWVKESTLKDIILDSLPQDKMNIHPIEGIRDRIDLYQLWGKSILEHLFDTKYLDKRKLSGLNLNLYNHADVFKDHIRYVFKKSPASTTLFHIFLSIIDGIKTQCQKDGEKKKDGVIYLTIHLDDFQEYVNEIVYDEFEKDIESIIQTNNKCEELERIKLIFSTRLFQKRRPYDIVIFINNFSKTEIEEYLIWYLEKMNDNCFNSLIDLIYEYTSGHPWFVDRFLHIYLTLRVKDRNSDPLVLAQSIFDNRLFWLNDRVFGSGKTSRFKRKIEKIIFSSTRILDENILNFLEEEEYDFDRFTKYKDHPIIKETGLIQISLDENQEEDIQGFGNKIMQLFFHKEIQKLANIKISK